MRILRFLPILLALSASSLVPGVTRAGDSALVNLAAGYSPFWGQIPREAHDRAFKWVAWSTSYEAAMEVFVEYQQEEIDWAWKQLDPEEFATLKRVIHVLRPDDVCPGNSNRFTDDRHFHEATFLSDSEKTIVRNGWAIVEVTPQILSQPGLLFDYSVYVVESDVIVEYLRKLIPSLKRLLDQRSLETASSSAQN